VGQDWGVEMSQERDQQGPPAGGMVQAVRVVRATLAPSAAVALADLLLIADGLSVWAIALQ